MRRSPAIDARPIDPARLAHCAAEIAAAGRELGARGWTPATGGNFSVRLDAQHALVTISGRDKSRLGPGDVMVLDLDGNAVASDARPSAEAALHLQLYRRFADIGAVLHTHSLAQTIAGRCLARGGAVRLVGWELLKAFEGVRTHETAVEIPVFPNSQDMDVLMAQVDRWLDSGRPLHAYLIAGHGIYAWGRDMASARRQLEACQFLLECELELLRLGRPSP